MRFYSELKRTQHPQACLIPLLMWMNIFLEELTEHQQALMRMDSALLTGYIETIDLETLDDQQKTSCWLAIVLSHLELSDLSLVRYAKQLVIQPASVFIAAASFGKLSLLEQVILSFGTPSVFQRLLTIFWQPRFLEPYIGYYAIPLADLIETNKFEAFRVASEHGQLAVMEYLMDRLPDKVPAMIKACRYGAFSAAVQHGHHLVMERLIELFPDEVESMIVADGYEVFYKVARRNDLVMFNRLIELVPEKVQAILKLDDFSLMQSAVTKDAFLVIERMIELYPKNDPRMILRVGFDLFRKVIDKKHLNLVNLLLNVAPIFVRAEANEEPSGVNYISPFVAMKLNELHEQQKTNTAGVFDLSDVNEIKLCLGIMGHLIRRKESACLDDLRFLLNIRSIQSAVFAKAHSYNHTSPIVLLAVSHGNFKALDILLSTRHRGQVMLTCQGPGAFMTAVHKGDDAMTDYLLNDPTVFVSAVGMLSGSEEMDYHAISYVLMGFVNKKIAALLSKQQQDLLDLANPLFDTHDPNEVTLCFNMLRYLIKQNEVNLCDKIRMLLDIPAVKARVDQEDKPPGTNGLLKLALSIANQGAISILLRINFEAQAMARADYIPSEGPLPQNIPTVILSYVAKCCLLDPQSVNFEIDSKLDEIVVTLPNAIRYNLSLLLRHSDFTELLLTDDLFAQYLIFLSKKSTIHKPKYDRLKPEGILRKLPLATMSAINLYTTDFYRIINPLCRGQVPAEIVSLPLPSRSGIIMEAFFVALFSAQGLAKLQELQVNAQRHEPKYPNLHRAIEQRPMIGFFFREQANLSTSLAPEGSEYFKHRSKLVIIKESQYYTSIASISQASVEREVLFPGGTVLLYSPISKDNTVFTAQVVRTPDIHDPNGYQALVGDALRHAYFNYLNKQYPGQTTPTPRPNHGIVHTVRTLSYVDLVLNYFMRHASSALQPYFYELPTVKIKLLLVFYSTGRSNEMAFSENPKRYQEFRKQSVGHFKRYLQEANDKHDVDVLTDLGELKWSEHDIETYGEVLEQAGNPKYLQTLMEQLPSELNNGFKIALWSVLTLSHCLDLARCYDASKYGIATTEKCMPVIQHNDEESMALTSLRSFALRAIQATDDHCLCQLGEGGRLIDVQTMGRGRLFVSLSTKLKECEDIMQRLNAEQNMVLNMASNENRQSSVYHAP